MMGTSGPTESALTAHQIELICATWPYVSWSDHDTDRTILDAKVNNARHDGFCGIVMPLKKK